MNRARCHPLKTEAEQHAETVRNNPGVVCVCVYLHLISGVSSCNDRVCRRWQVVSTQRGERASARCGRARSAASVPTSCVCGVGS
jgi:hypothetical protein